MKFLDKFSTLRQSRKGRWGKLIPKLMGALLLLCLAGTKPGLGDDTVWTSKLMTVLAEANGQYDPVSGTPRQTTDVPARAFKYGFNIDGDAMSEAISGGPGSNGEAPSVLTRANAWGNFFASHVYNRASSSAGFQGRFVTSHTEYLLCFDVIGCGINNNMIQILDPNVSPPTVITTKQNVTLGKPCWFWMKADYLSYPEAMIIINAASLSTNTGYNYAFCQITPQVKKEIILTTLPNNIKIVLLAEPNGARVVRVWEVGQTKWVEYIAGCYYFNGFNDYGQVGETNKYRYTNMKPSITIAGDYDVVDVYEYNGDIDHLTKIRYLPDLINNKDAKEVYLANADFDNGNFKGGLRWDGVPQVDSEALGSVLLQASLSPSNGTQVTAAISSLVFAPRSTLTCTSTDGAQWNYGLSVSDSTGGLVSPGDKIIIEGSGIAGGSVGSKAATAGYGAWVVKEVNRANIVFEATVGARFSDMADGFIVNAISGASQGKLNYRSVCNFIGGTGQVPGPVKNNIVPLLMLLLQD